MLHSLMIVCSILLLASFAVAANDDFLAATPTAVDRLWDVSFSPDGTIILAGAGNVWKGEVAIYEAKTGKVIRSLPGSYGCAAFSSDGKLLAAPIRDGIKIWESGTGKELKSWAEGPPMITRIAFSPDDKYLAAASFGGDVKIWDTTKWTAVRSLETPMVKKASNWVLDFAWSKDGKHLVSAGHQAILLWDVKTGKRLHKFGTFATCVALSPDGKTLAANSDEKEDVINLWDINSGRQIRKITLLSGARSIAFHPEGKRIISGDASGNLQTCDLDSGKALSSFKAHEKGVARIAFAPDGKTFATASDDATVRVWPVEKLNPMPPK